jgi:hypothetical protein
MAIVDMDYGVVGYTGSVEEAEEPARKNMRSRAETLPKNLIARLRMHTTSTDVVSNACSSARPCTLSSGWRILEDDAAKGTG